eukprot:364897-Rhodomonas_salina.1
MAETEEETPATYVPRICAEPDIFTFSEFKILDQLTDGFTIASHEPGFRRIFWANEAACKFMMRAPLEVLQKLDLEQNTSPGMLKFGEMIYQTVQVNKQRYQFPKTVYFGGKPTTCSFQSHPIRVRLPGTDVEKICVLDRITWEDTKKMEVEEKSKTLQLAYELLTNVDCNIISFHKERQEIVFSNHFAKTFWGKSLPEKCSVAAWLELCQFESDNEGRRAEVLAKIEAMEIMSPLTIFECYVERSAATGAREDDLDAEGRVWHRVLVRAIYDPNSGDLCYMVQELLVTVLKEAQLDLLRAQKEREMFFVSISHDLRSPLNGLVGLASSLLMDPKIPSHQRNSLRVIMNSGERLVGLVNDILDAGAIASGALTIREGVVELASVAREVVEVLSPLVKKGVQLLSTVDDDIPPLLGDAGRLNQILTNLVANSTKYTTSGKIRVGASMHAEEPGFVRVAVHDDGIGIPDHKLDQVWEAFRQVDSQTTKRYGGTGLGLSLVKSLVEAHGGR